MNLGLTPLCTVHVKINKEKVFKVIIQSNQICGKFVFLNCVGLKICDTFQYTLILKIGFYSERQTHRAY